MADEMLDTDFDYEQSEDSGPKGPAEQLEYAGTELNGLLFGEQSSDEDRDDPENEPAAESATIAELKAQNEALAERMEQMSGQFNGFQSVQQGLDRLGDKLEQDREPQQKPGESDEEFKQRLNESLYENPYDNLEAWGQRRFGPVVQQMMERNLLMQKKIMKQDPTNGTMFAKYEKEIDKELAAMPPQMRYNDPDVLEKAYKNVIAMHVDEIVEQRMAERSGQDAGSAEPAAKRSAGPYSGTSTSRSTATGTGEPRARTVPDYVREFALKRGMHEADAYAFMKENNLLRRK
jgi:hypothetical protein